MSKYDHISIKKTQEFFKSIGLPEQDDYSLPTSLKRFSDGSQYKIEIPTVNSIETCKCLLTEAHKLGIVVNRIDETLGIFRHTKQELVEYLSVCKEYGVGLNLSIGSRATYDISATRLSEQGKSISYRLRGTDQLINAIEDVQRVADLGCRGILVYDEGLLWVLNEMRQNGLLPQTMKFKNSAHNGHANPASFHLLELNGADSINPVRDLSLPIISSLRATVNIPIDIHIDNPVQSGGFIRTYDAPEIVRIGAPVFLKTGNSVLVKHGQFTDANDAKKMIKQVAIVKEFIDEYYPEAVQGKNGFTNECVPE